MELMMNVDSLGKVDYRAEYEKIKSNPRADSWQVELIRKNAERSENLKDIENELRQSMRRIQSEFIFIGGKLLELKEQSPLFIVGCYDVFQYGEKFLGLKRTSVKNLMSVCEEFGKDRKEVAHNWSAFAFSQLVEMLPLTKEQREEMTPNMTVKQIREKKSKFLKLFESTVTAPGVISGQIEINDETVEVRDVAKNEKEQTETNSVLIQLQTKQIESVPVEVHTDCWEYSNGLNFNNDDERKAWIKNYQSWGLWLEIPELKMRYYRYQFNRQNVWFVVSESWYRGCEFDPNPRFFPDYYIVDLDKQTGTYFNPHGQIELVLIGWLKDHRKELSENIR